jgi:formate dehydrogenase subunit gamma
MSESNERLVLRYLRPQRLAHWLGATGFLLLLMSGLILLFPPLSFLAAGGWSRLMHQIGAILFIAWPLVYAILYPDGLKQLLKDSFTYGRDDWEWAKKAPGYFFGHAHGMPPQGRINAGEKFHHAASILAFVAVTLSGLVLWFGKGALGAEALAVTAILHNLSMLALIVLFVGHLYFTFVYDALSGMWSGYVTEEYAQMEHAKWLENLPQEPPYVIPAAGKPGGN